MVYNIKEYRSNYYPNVSESTVLRIIHRGVLPVNHKVLLGRKIMIEILGIDDGLSSYFNASVEFNARKNSLIDSTIYELAAELCVKYDISITKFFKFHAL